LYKVSGDGPQAQTHQAFTTQANKRKIGNGALTLLPPSTLSRHDGRRSCVSGSGNVLTSLELPLVDVSLTVGGAAVSVVLVMTVGVAVDMVTDTLTAGSEPLSPPPPDCSRPC